MKPSGKRFNALTMRPSILLSKLVVVEGVEMLECAFMSGPQAGSIRPIWPKIGVALEISGISSMRSSNLKFKTSLPAAHYHCCQEILNGKTLSLMQEWDFFSKTNERTFLTSQDGQDIQHKHVS